MRNNVLDFLRSRTCQLGLTYLAIIMVMSVGFSVVFYHTGYHELGRQLPPNSLYISSSPQGVQPDFQGFFQQRIDEGRHDLLVRLIIVNVLALLLGGLISYWLARQTLEPIEASMEAQSQFVGDASHELKTPLTAIKASNDVALRKAGLTLKQAKQVIQQNSDDVAKLQTLSEGLLRLAREDATPKPTSLSLQEATTAAMNSVLPLAQAKNISINDKTADVKVLANRQSLQQVVTILLDNAIKYSPAGAKITMTSAVEARRARLMIADKGVGIKADVLPHIFQRFYRGDKSRTKNGSDGYGLGLAIADKLIRENHGEISATSKPGRGSTFTIKLPLSD